MEYFVVSPNTVDVLCGEVSSMAVAGMMTCKIRRNMKTLWSINKRFPGSRKQSSFPLRKIIILGIGIGINTKLLYKSRIANANTTTANSSSGVTCFVCHRSFRAKISLISHMRTHKSTTSQCCHGLHLLRRTNYYIYKPGLIRMISLSPEQHSIRRRAQRTCILKLFVTVTDISGLRSILQISQTSYTAPCNGVKIYGAQFGGLWVFAEQCTHHFRQNQCVHDLHAPCGVSTRV